MENKTLWILIDLALLIGVIYVCLFWFDIMAYLKNPCGKCSIDRPEISPCLNKPIYEKELNPLFNFSEIIKE